MMLFPMGPNLGAMPNLNMEIQCMRATLKVIRKIRQLGILRTTLQGCSTLVKGFPKALA